MFKKLALISAVVAASLVGHLAQAAPVVSLVASASSVNVGSTFSVSLRISGVVDLFAWDADLLFRPAALASLTGQSSGAFFGGGDTFVSGSVDAVAGTIDYVGAALSGLTGIDGDGFLAVLTFEALNAGQLALGFGRVSLIDSVGNDIFIETEDRFGTVIDILREQTVPLPSSLSLALLALAALPAASRWNHKHRSRLVGHEGLQPQR